MTSKQFKKPEVSQIVKALVHMQEVAQTKGDKSSKYITDRCNTIARNIHKDLDIITDKKTGELTSEPQISYRYYTKLMEQYRNAIKDLGFKHHSIESHLKAFVLRHKEKVTEVETMLEHSLPLHVLRDNFIKLRGDSVSGSMFRKELQSIKFEHHLFYLLEPKGAVKDWRKEDDKSSLKKKLNKSIKVNPDWVKGIVNDILNNNSPSERDLAIAIALATGRRTTEVMKTAKFKAVDNQTLLFSGQLKTKNRKIFEVLDSYEIPCLVNAKLIVKALSRLRKAIGKDIVKYKNVRGVVVQSTVDNGDISDYQHNAAIDRRYNRSLNSGVRSILGNGELSFSACRALYTEITFDNHAKPGEARTAYRHRVLGHSLIETQMHYDRFIVSKDVEKLVVESEEEKSQESDKKLHEYLESFDQKVEANKRAKAMHRLHDWLKQKVLDGLKHDEITVIYLRRNCLVDGKLINANTIKTYLIDTIEIAKYKPEQKKPKSKIDKLIAEVQQKIDDVSEDIETLEDEIYSCNSKIEDLEQEIEEVEEERSEFNEDLETKLSDLGELESELNKLKAKKEKTKSTNK
jgi:hypothetical protein